MQPSAPPSRRTVVVVMAIVGTFVLLAAAGAIAWFAGAFDEKSTFDAAPAACAPVEPGLGQLGTGFTTTTDATTCVVMHGERTVLRISFKLAPTPADASSALRKTTEGQATEVAGLGDLAFRQGPLTVFRISNLMVLCVVMSTDAELKDAGTTNAQIRVFEAGLAERLAGS
ncbi:hypothetical protein [Paractinoplanes durhamensis]|uniref:Uncharacterized protein n=1 Tax=Paractinoplanes durhamensis TaxID=113563 RepID=A0ABQ3Z539_9ACTN|nr:hypothetical protein [Actinoplanes durhamensis]GIE04927.1 hypothetical protein Adu01nite_62770 [Actinoplanes durhamensis]